ncbi:diacylglycerol O-acyltransferase [Bradyrhizobium liaoningense]
MADGRKLSSLDASFLYLETPEMPMHVGSMAIFRLPDDYKGDFFEDFKAMIVSRLHIAPILKARLEKAPLDIDHPSWVEDDQFDIDRHIFRASLPQPRDRATLERIVGWMHAKLLNRARPLWEFYVFEGMKDNEVGLYSKMHHAAIDGGAGAALTNMIYDISPIPRKVEPPTPGAKPAQEPRDIAANLLDSYQQLFSQPLDASQAAKSLQLPRTGKSDIGSILFDNAMYQIESAVRFAGNIPTVLKSVSDVLGKVADPKSRESLASMVSPPTMLNKTISSERSFAGVSIPLSRAKALAKQAGGKLNDVVLALASGVVRRYLLQYGTLPAKSLTAAVPISLREEGNTEANNQVFGMICSIATNIEDPKARLEAIIAQSTRSKEMSHPLRALMPQVSNISMLGRADHGADPGAALQPLQPVGRAAAGRQHHGIQRARAAADALCRRRRAVAYLPGVDLDARAGPQHHRAELSRPARLRFHRRRQHHSACAGDVRYAAGGVCRAGGRLCAAGRRHQGRGGIGSHDD